MAGTTPSGGVDAVSKVHFFFFLQKSVFLLSFTRLVKTCFLNQVNDCCLAQAPEILVHGPIALLTCLSGGFSDVNPCFLKKNYRLP